MLMLLQYRPTQARTISAAVRRSQLCHRSRRRLGRDRPTAAQHALARRDPKPGLARHAKG